MSDRKKIYDPTPESVRRAAYTATFFLISSACCAVYAWIERDPSLLYILGFCWLVGPPVWFWYEYYFLYLELGVQDAFEEFKYGQQLSVAIWVGVSIFLFALVSSERFKSEPDTARPNKQVELTVDPQPGLPP